MSVKFIPIQDLGDRFILTTRNGLIFRVTFWIPIWWEWRFKWISIGRFKELSLPTLTIDLEQS